MNWKKLLDAIVAIIKKLLEPNPAPPTPTPEPEPEPTPEPIPGEGVITKGVREEKTLKTPCAVQFNIVGCSGDPELPGSNPIHLSWASSNGWYGGNPPAESGSGTAAFRVNKLKCYSPGSFAGEKRIHINWDVKTLYTVRLEAGDGEYRFSVSANGAEQGNAAVDAVIPEALVFGVGDPPDGRPGVYGAVISELKWEGEE